MKLRPKFVCECIFFFGLFIGCFYGLFALITAEPFDGQYLLMFFPLVGILGGGCSLWYNLKSGHAYQDKFYIPIKDFEVKEYDNAVALIIDNWIRLYTDRKDEIAKLSDIKCTQFYNIKKKPIGYKVSVYEQL